MPNLIKTAFAACALAVSAIPVASAADLPYIPEPVPVPIPAAGGWYLRGDIGFSNQQVDELYNVLYDAPGVAVSNQHKDFDGAPIFGVGIGYKVNRWFRADVTGEYRSASDFNGADIYSFGGATFPDSYVAKKSEWLGLLNGYVDLGSWHGLSPYVGAGVGFANVDIRGFTDYGVGVGGFPSFAYGEDHDEWNFAWALYAGVGFEVTDALTLDVGYRFLHMGDAESGNLIAYDGTDTVDNPMEFEDITSHDLRVGMRYQFN